MGFLGIAFFMIIVYILLNLMIVFSGIFLIAGLILFKTHETIAIILFVLSGLNFLGFTAWKIYELTFKVTIETSDGEVKIKNTICDKYKEYVTSMDVEKINEILDKYPALIYYEIRENGERQTLLFYGLYHCDVDMMRCALNHGEKFNDPKLNINSNFLRPFFNYVNGNTTDEIIDTVRFALEHGAKVVHDNWDLYERAKKWVMNDGIVSKKDNELLDLIAKYDNKPILERITWEYLYGNK
ncbi:MAG: hypothetical protein NC040_10145 [Muribaculaceae bacterium]|nr:hypothetical protein [Alistipes senegalensis]MCM1474410.1 hypothetical protein [Muribaculaceae bacterium]